MADKLIANSLEGALLLLLIIGKKGEIFALTTVVHIQILQLLFNHKSEGACLNF